MNESIITGGQLKSSIEQYKCLQKIDRKKFYLLALCILVFWYISLFPGRAGADASGLIRLIKSGSTTNWWTSPYFWFIKISTFDGRTIALTSFLLLITQAITFFWCVKALPGDIKLKENSFLILLATPLFTVFGLNIGHDTLQVSGLFILIGIEMRRFQNIQVSKKRILFTYTMSFVLLTTTHTGMYIVILSMIILCLRKQFKHSLILAIFISLFMFISNIGIATTLFNGIEITHTSDAKFGPMLADLKCVAQHPLSDISQKEWLILELLIRYQGQIVTHGMLWDQIWDRGDEIKSNVIEVHLSTIRRKLAKHYSKCPIETVKPIGYRWLK